MGRKASIVILAEGARDVEGKPITSQAVKEVCTTTLLTALNFVEFL